MKILKLDKVPSCFKILRSGHIIRIVTSHSQQHQRSFTGGREPADMWPLFMPGKDIDIMRPKSILNKEAKVPLVFQVVDIKLGFLGREYTRDGRQLAIWKGEINKGCSEVPFSSLY